MEIGMNILVWTSTITSGEGGSWNPRGFIIIPIFMKFLASSYS